MFVSESPKPELAGVSEAQTERDFQLFLRSQYSSNAFLIILVGNTWLNLNTFHHAGDFLITPSDSWGDVLQTILRFIVLLLPFCIWVMKRDRTSEIFSLGSSGTSDNESPYLPYIQAALPVLLAILLLMKIIEAPEGLMVDMSPFYAILILPIVTFFLLRDTSIEAIFATWCAAILVLLLVWAREQAPDMAYRLILYTPLTYFVYADTTRQQKRTFMILTKLQDTLKLNEKLAVEAQALELRAMIGNVAHDLKTPLTSLLSSIEYMHDVLVPWEKVFVDYRPNLPSYISEKVTENFKLVKCCLQSMRGTNSFMTMTINRCLDYTKASKGFKLVPKLETVSLQAALEMPVQLMRDVQDTIEIEVLPLSAEVCLHVITDKQWLIENLLCLLSNAVKYSHKGCVQVSIRLDDAPKANTAEEQSQIEIEADEKMGDPHQMLRVEVQDTGIGLSDEAQKSLFNPFKQAQRLAGGTGLGLFSLAKRIEALQGQYGVTGRPDGEQGSLFWFTIPFRPDHSLARIDSRGSPSDSPRTPLHDTPASPPSIISTRPIPRRSSFNVLVVDDAPMIVKMTTMLLQRKGHTVQHAVNGADALEKLLVRGRSADGEEEPKAGLDGSPRSSAQEMPAPPCFDVVLMDLQMPVLDGIEAIRRLRAAEARRDKGRKRIDTSSGGGSGDVRGGGEEAGPPLRQCVIALSANSDEETRQEALAAGADLFLPKPFTYENFIDAVVNSLN